MEKRKPLTTDDLLRRQEEPLRKKRKFSMLDEATLERRGDREVGDNDGLGDDLESLERDNDDDDTEEYSIEKMNQNLMEIDVPEAKHEHLKSRSHPFSNTQTVTPSIKPSFVRTPITFSFLGISAALQIALTSMSIKLPTEIQAACIPALLAGRDCIGNAKTGSGKTIAFALPILQKLSADPFGIFALVLTPTRELAFQISEQFTVLGSSLNIRTAVVVGGMDMITQAIDLGHRPHVVIATPGRLVDHLRSSSGQWDLSRVKFLVLDEADRLLTPSFAPELSYLFGVLPKERQTCLFTATLTSSIDALADAPPKLGKQKPFIYRMPETIETVSTLKQYYILVPSHVREAYLYQLLCNPPESTIPLRRVIPESTTTKPSRQSKYKGKSKKAEEGEKELEQPPPTIIFCARPRTAAYLTILLKTLSLRSTALHSRLTQRERLSSLQLFRASVVPVLISTDVGARGLDIEDVAMVINWDMPNEPEEYTHRVGRTARAGRGGMAVSFVTEKDEERVLKIEERIKTKLEEMTLSEAKVLENLNKVSTAKRLANMELHDSNFGKREEVHMIKNTKLRTSS